MAVSVPREDVELPAGVDADLEVPEIKQGDIFEISGGLECFDRWGIPETYTFADGGTRELRVLWADGNRRSCVLCQIKDVNIGETNYPSRDVSVPLETLMSLSKVGTAVLSVSVGSVPTIRRDAQVRSAVGGVLRGT